MGKKKELAGRILSIVIVGSASVLMGFGQSSKAAKPARPAAKAAATESGASGNKVVLTVGNTKVTEADMDYLISNLSPQVRQVVETKGREPMGEQYTLMLLLSQKAQSEHMDATPEFRRRIAFERTQMLAQQEYTKMEKSIKVQPDEISAYYNAHKPDFEVATLREIVVRSKAVGAQADGPGLPPAEAQARIADIKKALTSGTAPAEVAKKYSVPNVVMVQDQTRTVRRGELMPALDKAAFEVKDNQFSDPIDLHQAIVVLQVLHHGESKLQDASPEIENTLREQKLDASVKSLKSKARVWMDPQYFKAPPDAPRGN